MKTPTELQIPDTIPDVRSPCLKGLRLAFQANLGRTVFVQLLPVELAFQGRRDAIFDSNAGLLATGRRTTHLMDMLTTPASPIWKQVWDSQVAEFEKAPMEAVFLLRTKLALEYIESLLAANGGMRLSMDAIFSSIVMDSWTAFECLCADVWIEIVNRGPVEIRQKLVKPGVLKTKENTALPEVVQTIDPSKDFAGSLVESRAVSFQILGNIEKFYGLVIGKDAMKRVFKDPDSGFIKALSAVRNILAHKAGKVDPTFESQVEGFTELEAFKNKEQLLLDGAMVRRLRAVSALCGAELLAVADDIITPP